ncbi:MAG: hypothetical protein L0220_22210 [Acidobacteria bacterium]|nr:hypothetical protein [Acidobacteriota bacterium]
MVEKNIVMRSGLVLTLLLAITALAISCGGAASSSSGGDLPEGIVKGARIAIIFRAGTTTDTFEIQEVRRPWVRATAINTVIWQEGSEVWLNLAAIDQIVIVR